MKRILYVLLLIVLIFGVIGCGGAPTPKEKPKEETPKEEPKKKEPVKKLPSWKRRKQRQPTATMADVDLAPVKTLTETEAEHAKKEAIKKLTESGAIHLGQYLEPWKGADHCGRRWLLPPFFALWPAGGAPFGEHTARAARAADARGGHRGALQGAGG